MQCTKIIVCAICAALSTLIVGCESASVVRDVNSDTPGELVVAACDGGYDNSPATRAYEQLYTTIFESGDVMGLFVVDAAGDLLAENIPYKLNANGDWSGELGYLGGAYVDSNGDPIDGVKYYAYFPYRETLSRTTQATAGCSAVAFFADEIAAWSTQQDQSAAGYEESDLMVAEGYFEDKLLNTHSLYFEFYHQMSMLHIELPYREGSTLSDISLTLNGVTIDQAKLQLLDMGSYSGTQNNYRYIVQPSGSSQSVVINYTLDGVDKVTSADVVFNSRCYVYYIVDSSIMPADSPEVIEEGAAVGAFWRCSESGERIISMQPAEEDYGAWRAVVYHMDANWDSRSDIALSADMSNFNASDDAESHKLTEGIQILNGVSYEDCPIEFRVGLMGSDFDMVSNTDGSSYVAARYATVMITYCNNTKYQLIYLRQGEDPDYLFRSGDTVEGAERGVASRFSAYNLDVDFDGSDWYNITHDENDAEFTEYPSQVGALFQWGTPDAPQCDDAWSPARGSTAWRTGSSSTPFLWSDILSSAEHSPGYVLSANSVATFNYIRPRDGSITEVVSDVVWDESPMMQSLFNASGDTSNSLYGYYADGYCDRDIEARTTIGNEMSARGLLFFNDSNFASLFFPIFGTLYYSNGVVTEQNIASGYWSAATMGNTYPWALQLKPDHSAQMVTTYHRNTAMPVRPVVATINLNDEI